TKVAGWVWNLVPLAKRDRVPCPDHQIPGTVDRWPFLRRDTHLPVVVHNAGDAPTIHGCIRHGKNTTDRDFCVRLNSSLKSCTSLILLTLYGCSSVQPGVQTSVVDASAQTASARTTRPPLLESLVRDAVVHSQPGSEVAPIVEEDSE